jgi:hypothetical protein
MKNKPIAKICCETVILKKIVLILVNSINFYNDLTNHWATKV